MNYFFRVGNQVAEPNVDILLDKMHSELLSKKKKNVDVIHFSAQICRALMGNMWTNLDKPIRRRISRIITHILVPIICRSSIHKL